jgi:hypothetical protein
MPRVIPGFQKDTTVGNSYPRPYFCPFFLVSGAESALIFSDRQKGWIELNEGGVNRAVSGVA